MSVLTPFRALRPAPDAAPAVASVPYDVVSTEEARALAAQAPLSFLRVTRAEIDLPPGTNPYSPAVYAQAVRNLEELTRAAPLIIDDEPSLYVYRLQMGHHEQTGIAATFSLDEYDQGLIKKHEKTRRDKEDDRTRHILELRAQTGIVFLTYRASNAISEATARATASAPLYDFVASDNVVHTVWRVSGAEAAPVVKAFARLPAMYIADGHHRIASAARARAELGASGEAAATRFIGVAFPDTAVQILPYNRIVKDLAGRTPAEFLAELRGRMDVVDGPADAPRPGQVAMHLDGRWLTLTLPPPASGAGRAATLDVEVLHQVVLAPLLGIGDVRSDKRIDFIGGGRGSAELERRVASGDAAVAFAMYPVSIADLLAIADEGGIMPPKSTWFEPKLRDGLLVHLI